MLLSSTPEAERSEAEGGDTQWAAWLVRMVPKVGLEPTQELIPDRF